MVTGNGNNQLLTFGHTTLAYDFNGNMRWSRIRLSVDLWDACNRLTGITATGLTASFAYKVP